MMRKVLAILLLTIYLISATELSQLLKIPVLIEHYIEHRIGNPEMSVMAFLALHYDKQLKNHPHDNDEEKDQKLPFLAHTDVLSFCFIHAPSFFFEIKDKSSTNQHLNPSVLSDVFFKNRFLSSIWQPPKFC